jgi:hypothetical protein
MSVSIRLDGDIFTVLRHDSPRRTAFLRRLCEDLKTPFDLFDRCDVTLDDFSRDFVATVQFKAAAIPPAFMQSAERVHQLLNHEFRGDVIRAAVPEMAAMLDEMFSRLAAVSEPRKVRLTSTHIQSILRKIDGTYPVSTSPNLDLRFGGQALDQPPR